MSSTAPHPKGPPFGQREQAVIKLIGVAIATRPEQVARLLRRMRMPLPEKPTIEQQADAMMRALAVQHPEFQADLTELLEQVEAEHGSEIREDESAAAIATAVGMVSQGVGSIFSSRNDRKAAEATAKASEQTAATGLRATMIQAANNIRLQTLNSQMLQVKGNQNMQLLMALGALILLGLAGYAGYKAYMKQRAIMKSASS